MQQLYQRYKTTRQRTMDICKPLKTEDYIPQPVVFASPAKWQIAHTTWFFEEMILKKYAKGYREFHSDFSFLFNSYYQSVGDRTLRAERGNMTRPLLEEVLNYRAYVDEHMHSFIQDIPLQETIDLVELGIQHEQQHQELMLTDIKYLFGHNPLFPVYSPTKDLSNFRNKHSGWLTIPEGIYSIGYNGEAFCFDNETAFHNVFLQTYKVSKSLVTNGEYLEFMEDGGYQSFQHWLDDGWSWLKTNNIESPLYWHKINGEWFQYTLAGLKPLKHDSILTHISFYEANAFAAWKGLRLPTEFEWEIASDQFEWGKRWEWTNSAYLPYPGFKAAPGAVGEYNGKFMINQMVLRGGSAATSEGHSRKTYRNFFHPHFQWQFSGIRLAK